MPGARCYRLASIGWTPMWASITSPSSLLRAHAPDPIPPLDLGFPIIRGVFAGRRPSRRGEGPSRPYYLSSLRRCLDPCPAVSFGCTCSLLPQREPLHATRQGFRTRRCSLQSNVNRGYFSRLQSFRYVQAPTLAQPAGCSHPLRDGQAFYTTHRSVGYLPRDVASLRV